jgi:hypothetical protein
MLLSVPLWRHVPHVYMPLVRYGPDVVAVRVHRAKCLLPTDQNMAVQEEVLSLLFVRWVLFRAPLSSSVAVAYNTNPFVTLFL